MLAIFHWMIYWLIIYGFTSRSSIFHLYGDVTIDGEGLQNLGLCLALRAIEQGHGASGFPVSSEGPPHLVASYDTRSYSNPDPHGARFLKSSRFNQRK
jgi:hypothetical protein